MMMTSAVITSIGFLHMVGRHAEPLAVLREFAKEDSLPGALVVLPEVFNKGVPFHHNSDEPAFEAVTFLDDLMAISRNCGAVFVVGVLDQDGVNSVFLVDGQSERPHWMCHKRAGFAWAPGESEGENPIEIRGVCVGALVCDDINLPQDLIDRVNDSLCDRKVICVPAAMTVACQGSRLLYPHWNGKYVVLANGAEHQGGPWCGSFVTYGTATRVVCRDGTDNVLSVKTFAEIDAVEGDGLLPF